MMNLAFLFAKRYLFSKKSVNAINIISLISLLGIIVSSAALIILLSSFNGMENLIFSMYSKFAPEFRIEPSKGKFFDPNDPNLLTLKKDPRIIHYTPVLQEKVLLQYDNRQFIANLKGIDPATIDHQTADSTLLFGDFNLLQDTVPMAVIGAVTQANLGVSTQQLSEFIQVYSPKKGGTVSANPADEFNMRSIIPTGILKFHQQFGDMIITPIHFAEEVIGEYGKVSAIEFYLKDPSKESAFKQEWGSKLGSDFQLKNREEQNPSLYKNVRVERWAVFFILTLISVIAIFNIVGSLTMLVLDKKEDMLILQNLGAKVSVIRRIFFYEGLMISFFGCVMGLITGFLFTYFQHKYGFIKVEEGARTIVDSYPMISRWQDYFIVFFTITMIAGVISYFSARVSVKQLGKMKEFAL